MIASKDTSATMVDDFRHVPVLADEVIALVPETAHRMLDCTLGGAGHAQLLLRARPQAELLGLDRDPTALGVARERLAEFGSRAVVHASDFAAFSSILDHVGWGAVDFLLADLGVSSPQLDQPERGFSFRSEGPLDMRMSCVGPTAAEFIAESSVSELTAVIRTLGEERHASRVARAIKSKLPTTTQALAEIVRGVVPKSRDAIDPATRTFQALRMAVNDELGQLQRLLDHLRERVSVGGVVAIISFHSLEDRAVKSAFRSLTSREVVSRFLPADLEPTPSFELLTKKPITASDAEASRNRRARSAKLRAVRKVHP